MGLFFFLFSFLHGLQSQTGSVGLGLGKYCSLMAASRPGSSPEFFPALLCWEAVLHPCPCSLMSQVGAGAMRAIARQSWRVLGLSLCHLPLQMGLEGWPWQKLLTFSCFEYFLFILLLLHSICQETKGFSFFYCKNNEKESHFYIP